MTKDQAKLLFGEDGKPATLEKVGRILGRGKAAISLWPENLTQAQINMVIGAAVRRGIAIPDSLIKQQSVN